MKKTKTNKKIKKVTKVSVTKKITKTKGYESHYLAIILVTFLLLEGFLFTNTALADWQQGTEILDVSVTVSQTVSNFAVIMTPIVDAVKNVDTFYQMAVTEMIYLLDLSDSQPTAELTAIWDGVTGFYEQATTEMASMLDVSSEWSGNIAGASIFAY